MPHVLIHALKNLTCRMLLLLYLLHSRYKHTPHKIFCSLLFSLSHTVISVLLISVRNHTVHFISQFILKARNGLTGSPSYQVRSSVLHIIQAHVTSFSNLSLGKTHKLRVPGVDTKTLGDQDLTWTIKKKKKQRNNDEKQGLYLQPLILCLSNKNTACMILWYSQSPGYREFYHLQNPGVT